METSIARHGEREARGSGPERERAHEAHVGSSRGLAAFCVRFGLLCLFLVTASGITGCKQATKDHWIAEMKRKLPEEFCKSGTVFSECFAVTKEECLQMARTTTNECLEKLKADIPRVLKQPEDGRHWGSKVGACAGEQYELRLLEKKQMTSACKRALEALGLKAE